MMSERRDQLGRTFPEICNDLESQLGRKISPLKRRFAYEYVRHGGNQTKAALAAGASPRRAQVSGSEMARDETVRALIEELEAEVFDISQLTPEVVLRALLKEARQAEHSRDRREAWHLIGKHLGMFKEQAEHSHLHAHMDKSQLILEIRQRFGIEAARRAMREIGYSENAMENLVGPEDGEETNKKRITG